MNNISLFLKPLVTTFWLSYRQPSCVLPIQKIAKKKSKKFKPQRHEDWNFHLKVFCITYHRREGSFSCCVVTFLNPTLFCYS